MPPAWDRAARLTGTALVRALRGHDKRHSERHGKSHSKGHDPTTTTNDVRADV